jgi:hypothetical protein
MQDNQDNNRGIRPGILIGIGAVAAVLVAAIAFLRRSPGPAESGVAVAPEPAVATRPAPPSPSPVRPAPTQPSAHTASPPAISPAAVATSVPPSESTNWEQRVDTILGSDQIDEAKKAEELLALFPNLPEEGQLEAIQHISNLLPDDRYAAITPMLTSAQTSEAVLEVLLTDLLNRPNELKLPALLQVARTPDHPKAADARDILEVFVDENYGNDWAKWESAVQKYLKENPE